MGWYQTAPRPPSKRLRSIIVNVTYFQNQCNYLFPRIPPPQVERINKEFGGNTGKFSRTLFTIGENDPWTPLTIAGGASSFKNYVFTIVNGSHVNDLRFPTPQDSKSLSKARVYIRKTLATFLKCRES